MRSEQIAALAKYFHFTLADIDALSIDEMETFLEIRNKEIKKYNESVRRGK